MNFFNEVYATKIQHITIWLELIGFTLTFIEILFPKAADFIETRIDEFPLFIYTYFKLIPFGVGIHVLDAFLSKKNTAMLEAADEYQFDLNSPEFIFSALLVLTFMFGTILSSLLLSIYLTILIDNRWVGAMIFGVFYYMTFWIIINIPPRIVHYLNSISKGKALGTMGLSIAFIGLLGELYQYLTMLKI